MLLPLRRSVTPTSLPRRRSRPLRPRSDDSAHVAEFIDWLAFRHPAIGRLRDEHVAYYEELLPHVLFGDITRYAAELAQRAQSDAAADAELDRLLQDLDAAIQSGFGTDDPVENVIWVSFVENAQGVPGDAEEPLRNAIRRWFHYLAHALSHHG